MISAFSRIREVNPRKRGTPASIMFHPCSNFLESTLHVSEQLTTGPELGARGTSLPRRSFWAEQWAEERLLNVCACVCMRMRVYPSIYLSVSMYIYIEIERCTIWTYVIIVNAYAHSAHVDTYFSVETVLGVGKFSCARSVRGHSHDL